MLTAETARSLAAQTIARLAGEGNIPLRLIDEATVAFENGWIFYWDADCDEVLAGNAPLVIFANGDIRCAPTAFAEPAAILQWLRENPTQGFEQGRGAW
jgi:hypothetical protein